MKNKSKVRTHVEWGEVWIVCVCVSSYVPALGNTHTKVAGLQD